MVLYAQMPRCGTARVCGTIMVMQLEELTKSQIVLLTMLVSFVTSIATGIVTAALIEEAPADVTRVIQRVVERTVETVTPAEGQQAAVVTRERTVIVKESDLIAAAVAQNSSRVVRVLNQEGTAVALGAFVGNTGQVATDAAALTKDGSYSVSVGSDEAIAVEMTNEGGARGIALLKMQSDVATKSVVLSEKSVQVGQTVIAFAGSSDRIAQGIITGIEEGGYIATSIDAKAIMPGAPLINADGEVIGMSTGASREKGASVFLPARSLVAQQASLETPAPSQENAGAQTEAGTTTENSSDSTKSAPQ
ncbi:MAG: hypothetical protein Q8P16_00855 [bacterium]|nr:hypothetical protein [bacterium]